MKIIIRYIATSFTVIELDHICFSPPNFLDRSYLS